MSSGDLDNWDTSKDYEVTTNAAGGGTKRDTDTAYDTVGTGGEGASSGAARHYETGHPATGNESDANEARLSPPAEISKEEVRRLVEAGAQLVEVLPAEEYEEEHLTGAINIPLKTLDAETTTRLRKDAPVIVYCHDYQ